VLLLTSCGTVVAVVTLPLAGTSVALLRCCSLSSCCCGELVMSRHCLHAAHAAGGDDGAFMASCMDGWAYLGIHGGMNACSMLVGTW
jgi:hypothetical protein